MDAIDISVTAPEADRAVSLQSSNEAPSYIEIARRIWSPIGLSALAISLSFFCWLVPTEVYGRNWLLYHTSLGINAYLVLLIWYLLIALCSGASYIVGRWIVGNSSSPPDARLDQLYYISVSTLAAVGCLSVIQELLDKLSFRELIDNILAGNGNLLKFMLYENYLYGLHSLRYLSIIAGGVALFRLLSKHAKVFDFLNLLTLIFVSLISSRLSLVCAIFVCISIWLPRTDYIPVKRMVLLACFSIVLLIALNASRNIAFYNLLGIVDPSFAALSEAFAYLAAPFEGSLAAADAFWSGGMATAPISHELTTNSAFLEIYQDFGSLAFPYIMGMTSIFATLAGAFSRSRSLPLSAAYGVILYAFAEIFRIDLFRQGIFLTLMLGTAGLYLPLWFTLSLMRGPRPGIPSATTAATPVPLEYKGLA